MGLFCFGFCCLGFFLNLITLLFPLCLQKCKKEKEEDKKKSN